MPTGVLLRSSLAVFAMCVAGAASVPAATGDDGLRVAIMVGIPADADWPKAMDLACARLSKEAAIHLLERTEWELLLKEQKLTLEGLSRPDVRMRIQGVDLFVVCGNDSRKKPTLRIFECSSGILIHSESLNSSPDTQQAADILADRVRQAQQGRKSGRLRVSLQAMEGGLIDGSMDKMASELERLLEENLAQDPQFTVLDRKQLGLVNEERALVGGATGGLLTSDVRVIGTLDKSGNRFAWNGRALLSGNRSLSLKVEETDLPSLAAAIRRGLAAALEKGPVKSESFETESVRFFEASKRWFGLKKYIPAIDSAQASLALKPSSMDARRLAGSLMMDLAVYPDELKPLAASDEKLMEWRLKLYLEGARRETEWRRESDIPADEPNPPDYLRGIYCRDQPVQEFWGAWLKLREPQQEALVAEIRKTLHAEYLRRLSYLRARADKPLGHRIPLEICSANVIRRIIQGQKGGVPIDFPTTLILLKEAEETLRTIIGVEKTRGGDVPASYFVYIEQLLGRFSQLFLFKEYNFRLCGNREEALAARRWMEALATSKDKTERLLVRIALMHFDAWDDLTEPDEKARFRKLEPEFVATRDACLEHLTQTWSDRARRSPPSATAPINSWMQTAFRLHNRAGQKLSDALVQPVWRTIAQIQPLDSTFCHTMLISMDETEPFSDTTEGFATAWMETMLSEPQLAWLRGRITLKLAKIHEKHMGHPDVAENIGHEVFRSDKLSHSNQLNHCAVLDGRIYILVSDAVPGKHSLRLMVYDSQAGKFETLAEPATLPGFPRSINPITLYGLNHKLAIANRKMYYATRDAGILVFDLDSKTATSFDKSKGLPGNDVETLAILGDQLYAFVATSEGALISMNLKDLRVDLIASTRGGISGSILDAKANLHVSEMIADAHRKCVWFWVLCSSPDAADGLWRLDGASGKVAQVYAFSQRATYFLGFHKDQPVRRIMTDATGLTVLASTVFERRFEDRQGTWKEQYSMDYLRPPYVIGTGTLWHGKHWVLRDLFTPGILENGKWKPFKPPFPWAVGVDSQTSDFQVCGDRMVVVSENWRSASEGGKARISWTDHTVWLLDREPTRFIEDPASKPPKADNSQSPSSSK
ncbi:MAG: hypothetical protein HY360_04180 [Verrucomicrobia bacterium]|nr:hypothetical protein [Verrucomicrobiota bacterium]